MGCLFEILFEIFGTIIIEGTIELVFYCYIKLIQLIVPKKTISEKNKAVIKNTVITVTVILMLSLFIGLLCLIQSNPVIKNVGKYMTYIPLIIIAVQLIMGITVNIVKHFRK